MTTIIVFFDDAHCGKSCIVLYFDNYDKENIPIRNRCLQNLLCNLKSYEQLALLFRMTDTKSKIKQVQHESASWKRTLEFLSGENAFLKNRLAEVLNTNQANLGFLEKAEQYQNRFIQNDQIIKLMRQDIAAFEKLLVRDMHQDGSPIKPVIYARRMLQKELDMLEITFKKLKIQFNNYVEEV